MAKNINIQVSDEVKDFLLKEGNDERLGARPLARTISRYLSKPLSREILFGNLKEGGKAIAVMVNDQISFKFESNQPLLPASN